MPPHLTARRAFIPSDSYGAALDRVCHEREAAMLAKDDAELRRRASIRRLRVAYAVLALLALACAWAAA